MVQLFTLTRRIFLRVVFGTLSHHRSRTPSRRRDGPWSEIQEMEFAMNI